ncbi:MAG: hypothetical protein ACKPJD_05690, partial [Planctomycetaceae bacterium]
MLFARSLACRILRLSARSAGPWPPAFPLVFTVLDALTITLKDLLLLRRDRRALVILVAMPMV